MKAITLSDARKDLEKTMQEVCDDHAPTIITREGKQAVVLMSLDEYEEMEETLYLLRNPKNARHLMESIQEHEDGKARERALLEVE